MTFDQLVRHFGSQAEVSRALRVSRQAVHLWKRHSVPLEKQLQAEQITDGALVASKAAKEFAARIASYAKAA